MAVIVAKCSVTSAWGYELLLADRSMRVSDCSIRVSQSGKLFLCQLCLQNSGIILDSFIPPLFQKLFKHNSCIPIQVSLLGVKPGNVSFKNK